MSELEARGGLAKQRIANLERELEASEHAQKDIQAQLDAAKAAAAREKIELQVCTMWPMQTYSLRNGVVSLLLKQHRTHPAILRKLEIPATCALLVKIDM